MIAKYIQNKPVALQTRGNHPDAPDQVPANLPQAWTNPPAAVSRPSSTPRATRLHRRDAAAYLGLSVSWLDKSRMTGSGPVYILIGGRVLYDLRDLDQFIAERRRTSVSGTGL